MIDFHVWNQRWTIEVLPAEAMKIIAKDDAITRTEGLCDTGKRVMYLNASMFDVGTIHHELWHVFNDATCSGSADLTADAKEEIGAEIFRMHGENMIKYAKELFKLVKHLRVK